MAVMRATKSIHSIRLSPEGLSQLKSLSQKMGRSESSVVEIAVDRMYREEVRFGHLPLDKPGGFNSMDGHKEEQ